MEQEKIICCCAPIVWARVIAWFQMIMSGIITVGYIVELATYQTYNAAVKKLAKVQRLVIDLKAYQTFLIIGLVQAILTLIFAIILLVGVNKRRPNYLISWIIFTVVTTISYIVVIIMESQWGALSVLAISGCVISVVVRGFGAWTVYQLKVQMDAGGSMGTGMVVVMDNQMNYQKHNQTV